MRPQEKRAIYALACMVKQYMGPTYLDSLAMSAGEHALDVLEEYGYVEQDGIGVASFTARGLKLLDWKPDLQEVEGNAVSEPQETRS